MFESQNMQSSLPYSRDEPSFDWKPAKKPIEVGRFEIRPPSVPFNAKPIYDAELDAVIGCREENAGVSRIYALDGRIAISERRIESPLTVVRERDYTILHFAYRHIL
jgi:hypothetical protein